MLAILGRMVDYTGQILTWEQAINSQQKLAPASYALDAVPFGLTRQEWQLSRRDARHYEV